MDWFIFMALHQILLPPVNKKALLGLPEKMNELDKPVSPLLIEILQLVKRQQQNLHVQRQRTYKGANQRTSVSGESFLQYQTSPTNSSQTSPTNSSH
jgi:hypothetical protein